MKESTSELVDLGLSVKWRSCNIGASSPEEYGGLYQWAGLDDVTDMSICIDWEKYDTKSYGTKDNKTTLLPEDDVAHIKLGGKWRMPTLAEWEELINTDNCTWNWGKLNGVNGYMVTSNKNGNSIFLPARGYRSRDQIGGIGGCGYYWSSSLLEDDPDYAYHFYFFSFDVDTSSNFRDLGLSVRPVSE